MCKIRAVLILLGISLGGLSSLQAEPPAPVSIRFVREVNKINPDSTFLVGVLFSIQPGWHVYYKNPGESGLATNIAITANEQVAIGDMQWPVPEKFISAGDVVGYGYSGSLLLTFPVHIASDILHGREIVFSGEATWLACSATLCVPGKAEFKERVLVGQTRTGAGTEVFQEWKSRFPKNISDISAIKDISANADRSGDRITLTLVINWSEAITDPIWIPDGQTGLLFAEQTLESGTGMDKLVIESRRAPGSGFSTTDIKGILIFSIAGDELIGTPIRFSIR